MVRDATPETTLSALVRGRRRVPIARRKQKCLKMRIANPLTNISLLYNTSTETL